MEPHPQRLALALKLLRFLIPNPGTVLLLIAFIFAVPSVRAEIFDTQPAPDVNSTTSMNYQGQLFDSAGNPLNGTVNLSFRIYDAPTNGNSLWGPENHNNVLVADGLFDVALGDTIPLSASMFGTNRWLQTMVNGEALSPRQQLLSVPVAQVALTVPEGAIQGKHLAPNIWRMDSGSMNVALTSTRTEYLNMTVQDDKASLWMIWWSGRATLEPTATSYGRTLLTLHVDNEIGSGEYRDEINIQSAAAASEGSGTTSVPLVLELTPGVPHVLRIFGNRQGSLAVLRSVRIVAMPIMETNQQPCSVEWTQDSYIDALSGGVNTDSSTCSVYNLAFPAP